MTNLKNHKYLIKKFIFSENKTDLLDCLNKDSFFYFFYSNKLNKNISFNYSIKNIKNEIKFLNHTVSFNTIFQKIYLKRNFKILNIESITSNYYYFIISKNYNIYKIDFIIDKEESPILFYLLDNYNSTFSFNYLNLFFKNKLNTNIEKDIVYSSTIENNYFRSEFDINKAISYAEKFAINYNKEYKNFDLSGGDCTNFVSQILKFGNLKENSIWKPYTTTWVRVKEIRNYLIDNNLAIESLGGSNIEPGSIVQFFHPDRKEWSHTGFITKKIDNKILYCCHSYDKLNYPLFFSYPLIYPKIRILTIK